MASADGDAGEITVMLRRLGAGDKAVVDQLLPRLYDELRAIAGRKMQRERVDHTLGTTALVHEAYLKLVGQERVDWQNRAHFLSVAAMAMRRLLINYAEARRADKRGAGQILATFDEELMGGHFRADQLCFLEDALKRLENMHPRQAQVVQYKFFGGLTYEEMAEVLGVSVPTIRRDWRIARAWLTKEVDK